MTYNVHDHSSEDVMLCASRLVQVQILEHLLLNLWHSNILRTSTKHCKLWLQSRKQASRSLHKPRVIGKAMELATHKLFKSDVPITWAAHTYTNALTTDKTYEVMDANCKISWLQSTLWWLSVSESRCFPQSDQILKICFGKCPFELLLY